MLNQLVCMGRMAVTPMLEKTPSGVPYCKFRIATERDYADKDGNRRTDFLSFIAWRSTAEFAAKHFTKGSMVVVRGRLEEEVWTDKESKQLRSRMIVNVDGLYFGETKQAQMERESRRNAGSAMPDGNFPYSDADIPPEFLSGYGSWEG